MGCCPSTPCVLDIAQFRLDYPQFADPTIYTDAAITNWWNLANCFMEGRGCALSGACWCDALYLMLAHLAFLYFLTLQNNSGGGSVPGLVSSATIAQISVSLAMPPFPNQWQWWMDLSPYGQTLLALLQVASAGGFLIGGSPERWALRKTGGVFMW